MPDVFISHGSKDKDIADKVVSYLEDRGLICWIAPRNIIPGSDWAASINTAITASRIFLLIYRANNASSSQVRREVGLASSRSNVFIIPFGVDDTPLHGSLEYYLNTSHWINADFANKDYQFEALYQNIITITGKNLQDISNNTNVDNLPTHHMDAQPESPKTPHKSRRKKKKRIRLLLSSLSRWRLPQLHTYGSFSVRRITTIPMSLLQKKNSTAHSSVTSTKKQSSLQSEKSSNPESITTTVLIYGYSSTGTYTGKMNKKGHPDGSGYYYGSYVIDNETVTVELDGEWDDGAFSGSGVAVSSYEEGIISKGICKGIWANGSPDGKMTLTRTYRSGDYSKSVIQGT